MLSTVLCLLFLGRRSLDLDEVTSLGYAHANWETFWTALIHDTNMSLYYLLLRAWTNLGTNEFVTRAFSIIPAVATVLLVYVFGTRFYSRGTGILAALLLTVNAFYIEYAQDARSYSLALCLVTLSCYLFISYVEHPSGKTWIGYVTASVLAVYSHFFAVFVLVAQWTSLLRARHHSLPWRGIITGAVSVTFLSLPLAIVTYLTHQSQNIAWMPRFTFLSAYPLLYLTGGYPWLDRVGGRVLMGAYVGLCLLGLMEIRRAWSEPATQAGTWRYDFLLSWLAVPILLTFGISLVVPFFQPRYLIVVVPALVILASLGLLHVRQGGWRTGVLSVMLVLVARSLFFYYTEFPKEGWREVTDYVASHAQAQDAILFYTLEDPYTYYVSRLHASRTPTIVYPWAGDEDYEISPRSIAASTVMVRLSCFSRAWLILSHDHEPNDKLRFGDALTVALADWGSLTRQKTFWDVRLLMFERRQPLNAGCSDLHK